MRNYIVTLKPSAERDLDDFEDAVYARIRAAIVGLSTMPRPQGVKKLKGNADFWRMRVGDYRILYTIDDKTHHIRIMRVAHRRDVYDR